MNKRIAFNPSVTRTRNAFAVVPDYVKQRVKARVESLIEIASKKYNRTYPMPEITYDLTGRVAGRARGNKEIMINSVLLMENLDDFIQDTVRHELAHCIDYTNNNGWVRKNNRFDVHGNSWKSVMRVLGDKNPQRCHSYDVSRATRGRRKKNYVYVCPECKTSLRVTKTIHDRISTYNQKRFHITCSRRFPIIFSHMNQD